MRRNANRWDRGLALVVQTFIAKGNLFLNPRRPGTDFQAAGKNPWLCIPTETNAEPWFADVISRVIAMSLHQL
jgi:hypothetical protein